MSEDKVEAETGAEQSTASDAVAPESGTSAAEPRVHGGAGEAALSDAGVVLGKAVMRIARVMLRRGGRQAKRAAESGRVRLDLRQLRRDQDVMYQKLGREVRHLVDGGEIAHPGLLRGVSRIEELEARMAEVEAELAARAAALGTEEDLRDVSGAASDEEVQDEDLDDGTDRTSDGLPGEPAASGEDAEPAA